jgi:hypothetical protein
MTNTPRFRRQADRGKHISPTKSNEISPQQQKPLFSLEYLNGKHCLSKCEKKEKAAFADTLHRLSQIPWAEIMSAPRRGLGHEKIAKKQIKAAIPKHIKDDTNFIAFRFFGKAPMIGYKKDRVFYVLWLDRTLKVYNHGS